MKLLDLFEEALILTVDNPGGEWLKKKRVEAEKEGTRPNGVPNRFGACTANFKRPALLPIDLLVKIPGMRSEQSNVREPDLTWLMKYMEEHNELPFAETIKQQYAPFIMVDQDGKGWVNEGNHRIMAAHKLKWKYLPVQVRYFNGGELESGRFSPDSVKKHDADAQAEGYSVNLNKGSNSFKGLLK